MSSEPRESDRAGSEPVGSDRVGSDLSGRVALVTGVSHRRGIGFAIARRLLRQGAGVVVHGYAAADHGASDGAADEASDEARLTVEALRSDRQDGRDLVALEVDLGSAAAPGSLVAAAVAAVGHLDILVCNHAHPGDEVDLWSLTPESLDRHWAVNARATLLLTQAFARQHDVRQGGRVVWLTSGQGLGPMSGNLAYATSKAALAGATWSVADQLVDHGILLNTVNPGPVDTGYLAGVAIDPGQSPLGRFGEPDDPARLVAWLVSDAGRWMVGQVHNSEGGFRR